MSQNPRPIFNPYGAIILGVAAASFSSIFTRLAVAPPLIIAFYRLFFTLLLLFPFIVFSTERSELKTISRRNMAMASLAGFFLALHFAVWITSLEYTSIASSTILVTMQPLFVVTLGFIFLKEKISFKCAAGAAITLAGSVIVGAGDFRIGGQAFLGDILAFSGAFFVALYILIGRDLRGKLSLVPYVFLVYGTSTFFLLIFNLLLGLPLYPYPSHDWLCFVALAVIPTILGHTVFNWALRYVKAAVVSVSILGEPIGATVLGFLIFAEVPGLLQLAGGLVIIGGMYMFISSAKN